MGGSKEARLTHWNSLILSSVSFFVVLPFLATAIGLLMHFARPRPNSATGTDPTVMLVGWAIALIMSLFVMRYIYNSARWRKPDEGRGPVISLTLGEWFAAALNFVVMSVLLAFILPVLFLQSGAQLGDMLLWSMLQWSIIPLFSAFNALLYLKKRIRKRIEAETERRIAANLCHWCEYNLTGNASGVCPECGEPILGS